MGNKKISERFPYLDPLDKLALFVFAPSAVEKDNLLLRISLRNSQILPILNEKEKEELKRIISFFLSPKERFIILSHFGIEREPLTLEEIGEKLQISRQRVNEIEKEAFQKIRRIWKRKPRIFLYDKIKKIYEENQQMKEIFLSLLEVVSKKKKGKETVQEIKKILFSFLTSFLGEIPISQVPLSKAFKTALLKRMGFQSAGDLAVFFDKKIKIRGIGKRKLQKIREALITTFFH